MSIKLAYILPIYPSSKDALMGSIHLNRLIIFWRFFYSKVCVIFSHRMLPVSTNKTIAQCMVFSFTDTIETRMIRNDIWILDAEALERDRKVRRDKN